MLLGDGDECNSNFTQQIKFHSEDNTKLLEWMTERKNKYTSPEVQNDMLRVVSLKACLYSRF